jgi:hypothetical protein
VAPEAWSWAVLDGRGAVAARALSNEGDDPGLPDPHLSVRGRRRPNRTSGAGVGRIGQAEQATAESDKRSR